MKYSTLIVIAVSISLSACFQENENTPSPQTTAPIKIFNASIIDQTNNMQYLFSFDDDTDARGEDGIIGTADDNIHGYMKSTLGTANSRFDSIYQRDAYIPSPKITYYNHPGTDELWFTEDDVISQYSEIQLTQNVGTHNTYDSDGADNIWFTPDDHVSSKNNIEILNNGSVMQSYLNPEDKTPYLTHTIINNNQGIPVEEIYFFHDNGQTNHIRRTITYDDNYETHQYDILNKYENPTAFTIHNKETLQYLVQPLSSRYDNFEKEISYDSGSDGKWDTIDDTVESYTQNHVIEDSENQTIIRSVHYKDSGNNQNWFDDDDTVSAYSEIISYEDEYGQKITSIKNYSEPGSDNIWFTEDDYVNSSGTGLIQIEEHHITIFK